MRPDRRLSRMLHVLIHLDRHGGRLTSDDIAQMLGTNPVVVRRSMAGLRERGYVESVKGHGGGWALTRPLSDITLLDVYMALGEPGLFALATSQDNPRCLVERAVTDRLDETLDQARELLLGRFAEITVAEVAGDFAHRFAALDDDEQCASDAG